MQFYQHKNKNKFQLYYVYGFIVLTILSIFLLFFFDSSIGNFRFPVNDIVLKIRYIDLFKTIIVGWSIGLSNYCFQYVTKNKFADVGIFGSYSFLQLCLMVLIIILKDKFISWEQSYLVSIIYSFVGVFSGLIFYLISKKTDLASKKILVYGIFLNTLVFALISLILNSVKLSSREYDLVYANYLTKMLGNISGYGDTDSLIIQFVIVFSCTIFVILNKNKMLILCLDKNKSSTLQTSYDRFKLIILIIIGLLSASTFALVGYIAFIGLAINFIINKLFKGIKMQLLMVIVVSIFITCFCQLLAKVFLHYFPVNNKSLPVSAFFGMVSFPIFCLSFLSK